MVNKDEKNALENEGLKPKTTIKKQNKSELQMRAGAKGKVFEKNSMVLTKGKLLEMFEDFMGEVDGEVDLDMNHYKFSFPTEDHFITQASFSRVFDYNTVLFSLESGKDIVNYAARSKEDAQNYINAMQKNNRKIVGVKEYVNTYEAERHY